MRLFAHLMVSAVHDVMHALRLLVHHLILAAATQLGMQLVYQTALIGSYSVPHMPGLMKCLTCRPLMMRSLTAQAIQARIQNVAGSLKTSTTAADWLPVTTLRQLMPASAAGLGAELDAGIVRPRKVTSGNSMYCF